MSTDWIPTKHPGIQARQHATRKHGRQPDTYLRMRYSRAGKRYTEGLGWASQGMSLAKANAILIQLQENIRLGTGPQSLAEMRAQAEADRQAQAQAEADRQRRTLTVAAAADLYIAAIRDDKASWHKDEQNLRNHVIPALGHLPLPDVTRAHVDALKRAVRAKGRAPATVKHQLSVLGLLFNWARAAGHFTGTNPVSKYPMPKFDNHRLRIFSTDEEAAFLVRAAATDPVMHDCVLLGVDEGLRSSEIGHLVRQDIDLHTRTLTARDTKNSTTRTMHLTDRVAAMLAARTAPLGRMDHVFQNTKSAPLSPDNIDDRFQRIADALGLNTGVTDTRLRLTFHCCRHTFGARLAMRGVYPRVIQHLLGHRTMAMAMRYADKFGPSHERAAIRALEKPLPPPDHD